jgi:hypothetical protein
MPGSPDDDNIHAIYRNFVRIETKKANILFLKQAKSRIDLERKTPNVISADADLVR